MREAVHLEVTQGIRHAIDVAHLSRQVEYVVTVAKNVGKARTSPDVTDNEPNIFPNGFDVKLICAARHILAVHNRHVCIQLDESNCKIATDETETACDKDVCTPKDAGDSIMHDGLSFWL